MNNTIILSEIDFSFYLSEIKQQKIIAVDTKTTGPDPHMDSIRLIQLAWDDTVLIIDCLSFLPQGLKLLKEVLESPLLKIFQNAGFVLQFFMAIGIFPTTIFDTMLAAQLLPADGLKDFHLKDLTQYYLNEELDETLRKSNWSGELREVQLQYAAKNAEVLLRLRKELGGQLRQHGLTEIARIEFVCAVSIAQMEYHGILLDISAWLKLTKKIEVEKQKAASALRKFEENSYVQLTLWGGEDLAGSNFESNAYLLSLLRKHGIMVDNTSKAALAPYRSHPLVLAISRYRTVSKLLSSFLFPIPEKIHPVTGRLHPQYAQIATWTGRMSCYEPNIQQIPRDTEFRKCFIASVGRRLLIADYSQIELRVVAQITQDKRMLDAYKSGKDLHSLTASIILNKPVDDIDKQERQYAKAVNFGLIYAMGANGLRISAQQSYGVEMTQEQAENFRTLFFRAYPAIKDWHNQLNRLKSTSGQTLSGRKYTFPQWYGLPVHSNTPVQGTAADILKKALGLLAVRLSESDTFIVATIHDEIIMECQEEKVDYYGEILKSTMEQASNSILKDVPAVVDMHIAQRWSEK